MNAGRNLGQNSTMNSCMQTLRAQAGRLTALWQGTLPVMNAPMPGVVTPELVAALSNSGGLGVVAGDFLEAGDLAQAIARVKELTGRPFAVNLRVRDKPGQGQFFDTDGERRQARAFAHALGEEAVDLGLDAQWEPARLPDFDEQFEAVLEGGVAVVTVAMGGLREAYAEKLARAGVAVIGAATCLREAKVLRASGAGAVIVQGLEAGGPRLNFEVSDGVPGVGLMSLIGPAARATGLPVAAAGGIMTARRWAAAMMAGASGVVLGTALVRSTESAAHPLHQAALAYAGDTATVLTPIYDGRQARVIDNGLIQACNGAGLKPARYPHQWCAMAPFAAAAARSGREDLMALYAGQGAELARAADVQAILDGLAQGVRDLLGEDIF